MSKRCARLRGTGREDKAACPDEDVNFIDT
jgi:hypothetical protein